MRNGDPIKGAVYGGTSVHLFINNFTINDMNLN